jgi:hypothetical protein
MIFICPYKILFNGELFSKGCKINNGLVLWPKKRSIKRQTLSKCWESIKFAEEVAR